MSDIFQQLRGDELCAVTFVQDYIQLQFDRPCINVYVPMTVEASGTAARSGDDRFRDALCGQIAKVVQSVHTQDDEAMTISFQDDSQIVISLRPTDRFGRDALEARGFRDAPIVMV